MAQLDFNKNKKKTITIILPDEKKTRLQVLTPTKALLSELSTRLPESKTTIPTDEDLDALYEFCARLMSRNKTATVITGEQLALCLDFEDLIQFLEAYTDFIVELSSSKN